MYVVPSVEILALWTHQIAFKATTGALIMESGERHLAADLTRAARFCACPNCERLAKRATELVLASLTVALAKEAFLRSFAVVHYENV